MLLVGLLKNLVNCQYSFLFCKFNLLANSFISNLEIILNVSKFFPLNLVKSVNSLEILFSQNSRMNKPQKD